MIFDRDSTGVTLSGRGYVNRMSIAAFESIRDQIIDNLLYSKAINFSNDQTFARAVMVLDSELPGEPFTHLADQLSQVDVFRFKRQFAVGNS